MAEPDWNDLSDTFGGRTRPASSALPQQNLLRRPCDHLPADFGPGGCPPGQAAGTGVPQASPLTEQGARLMESAEAMESLAAGRNVGDAPRSTSPAHVQIRRAGRLRQLLPCAAARPAVRPASGTGDRTRRDGRGVQPVEAREAGHRRRPLRGRNRGALFSRKLTDYRLGLYVSKTYFDTHLGHRDHLRSQGGITASSAISKT